MCASGLPSPGSLSAIEQKAFAMARRGRQGVDGKAWLARPRSSTIVKEEPGMPAPQVDLRLYALVDPERAGGHGLPELAWNVAAGGATLVQLRDKQGATRAMVEEARAIRENLVPMRVPFLINDRVDVALAAEAD